MPASADSSQASSLLEATAAGLCLRIGGSWRLTEPCPAWPGLQKLEPQAGRTDPAPSADSPSTTTTATTHALLHSGTGAEPNAASAQGELAIDLSALGTWDSALLIHLHAARRDCAAKGLRFREEDLPADMREMLALLLSRAPASVPKDRSLRVLTFVGLTSQNLWRQAQAILQFVGECVLSAVRVARSPLGFRWRDCLAQMQECGAMALPIVSLVSFLVGVTLAYTAAVILRLFGGDIWVADLIGLSVTREMAAVMTAVVLAGRTGAAFAAQIANMKANEEIDALATLGVPAVDFLVLPRILALAVMTPLLALYANLLGILGGMIIAMSLLSIPPAAYWVEMLSIVDLSDITTGLIKASAFGMIVGVAGCMRGLQADRSAEGVGKAATSAVVTAILLMVVADALFAVIFNMLGW